MKIIAFGGSTSKNSINKQLASYAAHAISGAEVKVLDLNDFALPMYSIDVELESGVPLAAVDFHNEMKAADLVVLSLAEHNGTYTTAFKNLFDWMTRHEGKTFEGMKMLLLATSPGGRGGQGVMDAALDRFPRHGAEIVGHFCLPFFGENFDAAKGIVNEELKAEFDKVLAQIA